MSGSERTSPAHGLTGPDALELLSSGRLEVRGLLPGASNATFLAEVHHDGRRALTVYKPRLGETPLWDYPKGTLHRREVAAFVLAEALGWPPVPATVLRDGPHGEGAVQVYVEAVPGEHFFTLREEHADALRAFASFDVLANNGDRKSGHVLLGVDGRVWGIDHGVTFGVEPNLRTVIWDFAGEPLPDPIASSVVRVAGALRDGPLRSHMRALLDDAEVDETAARAERLLAAGEFPAPGRRRHVPCPLV